MSQYIYNLTDEDLTFAMLDGITHETIWELLPLLIIRGDVILYNIKTGGLQLINRTPITIDSVCHIEYTRLFRIPNNDKEYYNFILSILNC